MASTTKVYTRRLADNRNDAPDYKIQHPPTVHIARGYDRHLPFMGSRPIICISDWQYETETQEHFWQQALQILKAELGDDAMASALILVAGDMASADNRLRGSTSDAVPRLEWLHDSVPQGDVFMLYGNHDFMAKEHLERTNAASGMPCILPHGACINVPLDGGHKLPTKASETSKTTSLVPEMVQPLKGNAPACPIQYTKLKLEKKPKPSKKDRQDRQWCKQNPDQAHLVGCMKSLHLTPCNLSAKRASKTVRIGAVHGIPASHNEGTKKIERATYFQAVEAVCSDSSIDIFMTHSNPCLPGQEGTVRGEDARKLYEAFLRSHASLHLHGHMHTEPVVSILAEGKVVVNSDCRVVVFVPKSIANS